MENISRNNKFYKKSIISAAVLSVLVGTPALAAEEETKKNKQALETITVTSQKRVQNVMKVPISVDTFSAQDIKDTGALNIQEIHDFMPGLEVNSDSATQPTISIRGVTSSNVSSGGDPSVAVFVDGVYTPPAASTASFSDMQRIEVLMGPQGTLFGRNSSAGAVSMVPNAPSNDLEGFVAVKLGNFGQQRIEGMINTGLSETVSLRVNAMDNSFDGWSENTVAGGRNPGAKDNQTFRATLKWDIADTTDLTLSYDYDKLDNAPTPAYGFDLNDIENADVFTGKIANDVIGGKETRDMWAVTAKLNHEFNNNLSMKATVNYREFDTYNREDTDGGNNKFTYLDTNNELETDVLYSEIQFNYVKDGVNAVFGANYSKENVKQVTTVSTTAATASNFVSPEVIAGTIAALKGVPTGAYPEIDAIRDTLNADAAHYWSPEVMASILTAVNAGNLLSSQAPSFAGSGTLLGQNGYGVTSSDVTANSNAYYDGFAGATGNSMIYGPNKYTNDLWQETVVNSGSFSNWGIFSDVTFDVSDRWELTFGARYSKDTKNYTWDIPGATFAAFADGEAPLALAFDNETDGVVSKKQSWDKVTGRAVANYHFTDNAIVFVSYSTGYKSGGFDNFKWEGVSSTFKPEYSTNKELGLKGEAFDGIFRGQFSIFEMDIVDYQKSVNSKVGEGAAIPTIINGQNRTTGLELKFEALASETLKLGLATTIRDAEKVWDAHYDALGVLQEAKVSEDKALINYTLRADWTPEIDNGFLRVHADYVFKEASDDTGLDIAQGFDELYGYREDTKKLNARISWENSDENIEVSLWAKNILDTENVTSINTTYQSVLGTVFAKTAAPRTYGIDFRYTF